MSMMCVLTLPLVTQCTKEREGRKPPVRVRYPTPAAEADNEKAGKPAPLGGPFGGGVEVPYTMRPTPLSTVPLDAGMADADLVKYLNKLAYDMNVENSQLILASCTKGASACGAGELAAIYVQPEIGANLLDMKTVTENGVIVARLINYDQDGRKEKGLGVPGNSRAWWVVRRKNNQLESLFLYRDFTPDPTRPAVRLATHKTFEGCAGHTPDANRPAMAKWWDCANENPFHLSMNVNPTPAGSYFRFVSNGPRMPVAPASGDTTQVKEGNVWITCSLGCCIAQ